MKKSLLALAVLGAYAGVASAQSSVQLFGTLDVNGRYIKNDGRDKAAQHRHRRRQQQRNPLPGHRRPGRRPEGGLQPALRHQPRHRHRRTRSSGIVARRSACTATRANCASAATTCRRSGPRRIFDAVRLQRHRQHAATSQRYGQVRQDNSIGYFLPSNLGGFYGQLMVAAGENGTDAATGRAATSAASSASAPVRSTSPLRTRKPSSASAPFPATTGTGAAGDSRPARRTRLATSAARGTSAS